MYLQCEVPDLHPEHIVRDLARCGEPVWEGPRAEFMDPECMLCGTEMREPAAGPGELAHRPECPWARAVLWAAP